jgi:hypothetical protein
MNRLKCQPLEYAVEQVVYLKSLGYQIARFYERGFHSHSKQIVRIEMTVYTDPVEHVRQDLPCCCSKETMEIKNEVK